MKFNVNLFRNVFANLIIATLLVFMFSLTYAGGVLNAFSSSDYQALYHGNIKNNNVTLMINVYWGTEYLDDILQVLEDKNVKTTFFVGGLWVSKNNEMLLKMQAEGHEIANHGFYHKDHKNLSLEKNQEEIYITHKLVKQICDIDMDLFAPPSGSFDEQTLQVAHSLGYKTIMWTKDTIDWRDKDTNLIYQRATKNPSNGDLILMHPTQNTLQALPDIIDFYAQKGFNLTTVSQNISL